MISANCQFYIRILFNLIRTLFSFLNRVRFALILFLLLLELDLLSLLGLHLLSLLEVGLLYCKVFSSINRLAYYVKLTHWIIIKSYNFLSNTLWNFIFLLACGLVLIFWVEDKDASLCIIKDADLWLVTLIFRYVI